MIPSPTSFFKTPVLLEFTSFRGGKKWGWNKIRRCRQNKSQKIFPQLFLEMKTRLEQFFAVASVNFAQRLQNRFFSAQYQFRNFLVN